MALLRVERSVRGGHVFRLTESAAAPGLSVAVIGHPLGDPLTITEGNVSRADESLWPNVQLDVSVSPGNSGGPVVLSDGTVLGVLVAKDTEAEGLAYALRSDFIEPVVQGRESLPAAAPADCARPLGPDYGEAPAVPASDALGDAVAGTFIDYFGGINSGDYRLAYNQLSPRLRSTAGFQSFADGVSTSFDFDFRVKSLTATSAGADVWLKFVSLQAPALGPDGESCTQWSLDYELVRAADGDMYIDGATGHGGSTGHEPCR